MVLFENELDVGFLYFGPKTFYALSKECFSTDNELVKDQSNEIIIWIIFGVLRTS